MINSFLGTNPDSGREGEDIDSIPDVLDKMIKKHEDILNGWSAVNK